MFNNKRERDSSLHYTEPLGDYTLLVNDVVIGTVDSIKLQEYEDMDSLMYGPQGKLVLSGVNWRERTATKMGWSYHLHYIGEKIDYNFREALNDLMNNKQRNPIDLFDKKHSIKYVGLQLIDLYNQVYTVEYEFTNTKPSKRLSMYSALMNNKL